MLNVITSNPISVTSLKRYHDNFIICHATERPLVAPMVNGGIGFSFKVYHQDGMDVEEYDEYTNVPGFKYEFIPVRSITQALDSIVDTIVDDEDKIDQRAGDLNIPKDEIMIVCACGKQWNRLVVQYINKELARDAESQAFDIYRHFRCTQESQLAQIVKNRLDTKFVYPEDPIAYAYALYQALGGSII